MYLWYIPKKGNMGYAPDWKTRIVRVTNYYMTPGSDTTNARRFASFLFNQAEKVYAIHGGARHTMAELDRIEAEETAKADIRKAVRKAALDAFIASEVAKDPRLTVRAARDLARAAKHNANTGEVCAALRLAKGKPLRERKNISPPA